MSRLLSHFYVGLLSLAGSVALAQEPKPLHVDIAAQPVGDALNQFAEQSGLQVVLYADDAEGIEVVAVAGEFNNASLALDTLLATTGLEYAFINDRTVAVAAAEHVSEEGGDSEAGNGQTAGATPRPVTMAQAVPEQSQTSRRAETDSDEEEKKRPLEEIIVTGTNIRGIAPESSPVRIFDREDILISGAATAQDFIQLLPENFGGGSNSNLMFGAPGDTNAAENSGIAGSLGSGVNLRGLGSGSTLVLLNGHRLAPSSGIGDFVDISLIPASAIERIEVLTDGASSIYGGDAVAGVVNFVLRDDYDGIETSLRYGTVTEGNLEEYRGSFTGGKSWDTGNALIVYEFFDQTDLSAEDRTFSQDAPLPSDILPSQRRHSILASASQEITSAIELFADFNYSHRETILDGTFSGSTVQFSPISENLNISGGGTWRASDTWYFDFSGTYSKVHSEPERAAPFLAQKRIDSTIWAFDAITSGALFDLPAGELKLAVGSHYRNEDFTNFDVLDDEIDRQADRDVFAVFSEASIPIIGPETSRVPFGRLEINVSGRLEDYSDFGTSTNYKVGLLWQPLTFLRLRASNSTSFNPPSLGRVGARDSSAFVARTSVLNTILGLTPGDPSIADVILINVSGTDTELEPENSKAFTGGFDLDQEWGRHKIEFTVFDIEFDNRIASTPIPGGGSAFNAPNIAFNSADSLPEGTVIFAPTQAQIENALGNVESVVAPFGDNPLDAQIINFASVVRNLTRSEVRGVDFDWNYHYGSDRGEFSAGLAGTFLQDFKQQAGKGTPFIEQDDTLFNPVNLKLRGRTGYAYNGLAVNMFVNYADDYRVDNTPAAMRIDSWTTIDLSLSYSTQSDWESSILRNTDFRLSVLNLLDEDPPQTPSAPQFQIFGYDPTNASPLNRFIAFQITKSF